MSYATKKAAIIKWIELATGYPIGKVIWDNQNMPRPTKPYISAKMFAFRAVNREYIDKPNISGVSNIITHKEFTLSIQCYSDGSIDPIEKLLNLQDSLNKNKYDLLLGNEQIAFVTMLMGPTDTTIKLDTMFESRASMDLLFRIPWSMTDSEQGLIEAVENLEAISLHPGGSTIMAQTIDIGTSFVPVETIFNDSLFKSYDSLTDIVRVQKALVLYNFSYLPGFTVVTLNAAPVDITDLEEDDDVDIVHIPYNGNTCLKTLTAVRT